MKVTNIATRLREMEVLGKRAFIDNLDYLQTMELLVAVLMHAASRRMGRYDHEKVAQVTTTGVEDAFERLYSFDLDYLNALASQLDETIAGRVRISLAGGEEFHFERLSLTHGLDCFERRIVLLLFFMNTSLRTRRMMMKLRLIGDEHRPELTAGTVLEALSAGFAEQLRNRRYFGRDSILMKYNLLHDRSFGLEQGQLIDQRIRLHPRIVNFILGDATVYDADFQGIEVLSPAVDQERIVLPPKVLEDVIAVARGFKARMGSELGRSVSESIGYGDGLAMLFHGPSGTGKTMLAHAVSAALKAPLVSMGSPNLDTEGGYAGLVERVFREARLLGGIVFIDECDDYFEEGTRASRALLIELERSKCLTILATNQKMRLDPALDRRIALKVPFDLPDEAMRLRIWEKLIPSGCALDPDVDLNELAHRYVFSGGLIKNSLLMALDRGLHAGGGGEPCLARQGLVDACDHQARSLFEKYEFGCVVVPEDNLDSLPLRPADSIRLKHLASCIADASVKQQRLLVMVACRCLETGLGATRAVLARAGLASREFTMEEALEGPGDKELLDPFTHEELVPRHFIFRRQTGVRGAVVLIDETDRLNPADQDGTELPKAVAELLASAEDSHDPVLLLTRKVRGWERIPMLDHCVRILPPSEEAQLGLWERQLRDQETCEGMLLAALGRHSLHGDEIDRAARKARVVSWVESGSANNAGMFVEEVLSRGRQGAPILFGNKAWD